MNLKVFEDKKVYRYHLKKITDMSDEEIITACHFYVEQNNLKDEWNELRKNNEKC